MPDDPEVYTEAHLVDALATDPRFGELGVTIRIDGERVIVEGVVPTAERRLAAEQIIVEHLPSARVENMIVVEEMSVPGSEPEIIS
jgi:hypothetical protein